MIFWLNYEIMYIIWIKQINVWKFYQFYFKTLRLLSFNWSSTNTSRPRTHLAPGVPGEHEPLWHQSSSHFHRQMACSSLSFKRRKATTKAQNGRNPPISGRMNMPWNGVNSRPVAISVMLRLPPLYMFQLRVPAAVLTNKTKINQFQLKFVTHRTAHYSPVIAFFVSQSICKSSSPNCQHRDWNQWTLILC